MNLVVATKNPKKEEELKRLLEGLNACLIFLDEFPDTPEVAEDGMTFRENAAKKALGYARLLDKLVLADDSGLEVDALGGSPGVYSSRYSGERATDEENNQKLLAELKNIPYEKRTARFRCAAALANKSGLIFVTEGVVEGIIGFEEKGNTGFGYDPLFIIPSHKKTFAELGPEIKDTMSHRSKAVKKAKDLIEGFIRSGMGTGMEEEN